VLSGVTSSPALRWLLILALPLTLGAKLMVRPDLSAPSAKDIQQKVAQFLDRQHFSIALADQLGEGKIMVRAGAGACRMLVANPSPMASDREIIRINATPADHVFVVFRGKTYKDQPTWLTVPYFLWSRLKRELGLPSRPAPLLTVISTPSCNAERLPWDELG
jgi:hypothetical protein